MAVTGIVVAALVAGALAAVLAVNSGQDAPPGGARTATSPDGAPGEEAEPAPAAGPRRAPVMAVALRPGDVDALGDVGRYDVVVVNAWEAEHLDDMRATAPHTRFLVYKDMASTRSYACRGGEDDEWLPTGVGWCDADAHHPAWFLTDTGGDRIEWEGYDDHWWMNVGDPGYRRAWLGAVRAELEAVGWDGVFIDNAVTEPDVYLDGRKLAAYPTDDAYRAASGGFLATVGPELRSDGFEVVTNFGSGLGDLPHMVAAAVHGTGASREHWARWGMEGEPIVGDQWDVMLAQQRAVEATGVDHYAIAYGAAGESEMMTYARASWLVGWDGDGGGVAWITVDGGDEPWAPQWTMSVGAPAGDAVAGGGAWLRPFTEGTVVVNPSGEEVTIDLGRPHRHDGGVVTSVTLAPARGAVLPYAG